MIVRATHHDTHSFLNRNCEHVWVLTV